MLNLRRIQTPRHDLRPIPDHLYVLVQKQDPLEELSQVKWVVG